MSSQIYDFQKPHRVDWINVFEPKPHKMDPTKLSYQVDWILERDDPEYVSLHTIAIQMLQAVAEEHALTVDKKLIGKAGGPFWPFFAGDKLNADANRKALAAGKKPYDNAHMAGKIILKTKSYAPTCPVLSTFAGGKWIDHDNNKGLTSSFYRGMVAYGTVVIAPFYASERSWGVTAYVNGVGAAGGQRIGGSVSRSNEYGTPPMVEGTVSEFDPTDDEIPF